MGRKRTPQGRKELEGHLREQLRFLERSAEAFDEGYTDEAKRLAVSMRVLVHDTSRSRSLLSQLDRRKDIEFCDSAFEPESGSLLPHAGLVGISVGLGGVKLVARLDGDDPSWFRWIDFETWWNAVVFRYPQEHELTRRGLVLAVANQDGGAHVDPSLDEAYAELSRRNALRMYTTDQTGLVALGEAERVAVRQIAHEMLKTLRPGYEKKPASAAIIGGVSVHFKPASEADED